MWSPKIPKARKCSISSLSSEEKVSIDRSSSRKEFMGLSVERSDCLLFIVCPIFG